VAIINRLNDNFRRRKQEKKRDNRVKNSASKKDSDVINWQYNAIFKKGKQHQKKEKNKGLKKKKKGKCYNCGKKNHFATDYYLKKNSTITPKPKEEAKKPKLKDKGKEKATINAMIRTQQ
jgi:Zinc knuckle